MIRRKICFHLSVILKIKTFCSLSSFYILKDSLLKIKFLLIAPIAIITVKSLLTLLPLGLCIKTVRIISLYCSARHPVKIPLKKIHIWYLRLNGLFRIKSCFVNSLSQKIIFSCFGYNLGVVCGVKFDENLNFIGHAWLCYKDQVMFESSENLEHYVESFRV